MMSFFKNKSLGKKSLNPIVIIMFVVVIVTGTAFFITQSNAVSNNQSSSKDYFDSEIEFLTSMAVSASYLKQTAVTDYAKAILAVSTKQGMEALHCIDTEIWELTGSQIGWALFFNSAVQVYSGGDVNAPIIGYYNPFADIFLITALSEDAGIYKIADAALLMGDFIRNESGVLEVIPFWLRGETYRPEAIGRSVALSLLAFERVFSGETLKTWRKRLPVFAAQDSLNEINYTFSALRLNEHLANTLSFSHATTNNQQLENCKAATIEAINIASGGNIDKLLNTADETSQNTAQRLKEISSEWFTTLRLSSVLMDPKGGLVFLSATQPTNSSLAIYLKKTNGEFQAKRIDLVDYQYFYGQISTLQENGNNGGVK